jgi:hypothetical protein
LLPLTIYGIVLSQLTSSVIISSNFSSAKKKEGYAETTLIIFLLEMVLLVCYLCAARSIKAAKMKKLKIFDKLMLENKDRATLEERFSEKSVLKDRFGDEKSELTRDGE